MKVIWPRNGATVREVYDHLLARRRISYSSVQTMMNVLEEKGHLRKEPGQRAHRYVPTRPQRQLVRSMVREFVDRVFDGSTRRLLVCLSQEKGLTTEERKVLQRLLGAGEP
jgi:BlaI family transcriptional regulator, penicillinase repressor